MGKINCYTGNPTNPNFLGPSPALYFIGTSENFSSIFSCVVPMSDQGGHWSGKFDFSSRPGKRQGILQIGQGNFKYQGSQGKVREFHNFCPEYVL